MPDHEAIILERDGPIATIRLNRPDKHNAINSVMSREMIDALDVLEADGDVRVIVLTGAGDKAFCAGGDLKERRGMTDDAWAAQHAIFERMLRAILACPLPVIAAAKGLARNAAVSMRTWWRAQRCRSRARRRDYPSYS